MNTGITFVACVNATKTIYNKYTNKTIYKYTNTSSYSGQEFIKANIIPIQKPHG